MKDPNRKPPWNRGPWGYVQPWDTKALGETILDVEEQKRWTRVMLFGGLPYMWRELAGPMNTIMYSLMEVKPGDKVFVIGESLGPCGWVDDLRTMVGPLGEVRAVEILEEARAAYDARKVGRNGKMACWQWNYTREIADASCDAVACLQAVQHCDDWRETGAELLRILKPGRRLMLAEVYIFGAPFWARLETDLHLQYWVDKLTHYFPFDIRDTPYYSPQELHQALDDQLEQPEHIEWKGIELFWGRKPAPAR
ncbi:MAG: hypothetical protein A3I01_03900 [Betaproteobacteria bacterium RIFCSPLOWO2_02_FULL_65_24]|nr:MAG: hypothetical protein A3I01_03900 [Betaproteobacteria bacterium RIFCSPLOWO2_02_FULL_65_24]OGA95757.1 MAG: hypothetical protein A3G27_06915 [Betaproteobacteria bacterium RIFCSPLOWO2_12_FULL_66_14]